jgi:methionine--tRNA ligase beta chain
MVTLDDFKKVELRTAKILDAQEIPGADRLWKLSIDVGSEKKEIVAGVKQFYAREALIGRTIVVVNNLAPTVIRGVESRGMLLAAKDGAALSLLSADKDLPPGSVIG